MRQKRFLIYLAIQTAIILVVVFIFKFNSDLKLASVQAGTLFVLIPVVILAVELKKFGFSRKNFYVGVLQFWLFFALPILLLRLLNWDTALGELSILGVQGTSLHKYASYSYILMMSVTLCNYIYRK